MRIGGRERSAVCGFHHELDAGWAAGHHEPHWCWSDIFAPLAGLSGTARSEVPVKRGIGNFLPPPRFWIHAHLLIPAFIAMTVVPTPLLSYSQRRLPARLRAYAEPCTYR